MPAAHQWWQCVQLVARQIGFDLSNMQMPSSILLMITDMNSFKILLNCSMCLVAENAYDTWLMSQNQECTSVMLAGVGKSQIEVLLAWRHVVRSDLESCKFSSAGSKDKIVWVEDSDVVSAEVKPANCLKKLLVKLSVQSSMLLMHFVLLGMFCV